MLRASPPQLLESAAGPKRATAVVWSCMSAADRCGDRFHRCRFSRVRRHERIGRRPRQGRINKAASTRPHQQSRSAWSPATSWPGVTPPSRSCWWTSATKAPGEHGRSIPHPGPGAVASRSWRPCPTAPRSRPLRRALWCDSNGTGSTECDRERGSLTPHGTRRRKSCTHQWWGPGDGRRGRTCVGR
jgi:hypothetical protein